MAWSDAARAAALETRRAHAAGKKYYGHVGEASRVATRFSTQKSVRKGFADTIRLMRAGKLALHPATMRAAVSSTTMRNYARKK